MIFLAFRGCSLVQVRLYYIDNEALERVLLMSRFVFFSAADGRVEVSIDQQPVGSASTAEELCGILLKHKVSITADRCCGSSSLTSARKKGLLSVQPAT